MFASSPILCLCKCLRMKGSLLSMATEFLRCCFPRAQQRNEEDEQTGADELGYRKARCLSSYYSVFVARLAIMVMLAILIGLLTFLTWHFTTTYTKKSIQSLAYSLRYELLQRPVSRMSNILNSTVEITTAQVGLAEYVVKRYPVPQNPYHGAQIYEAMKDITWAMFVSRKALNAITISYNNGRVQAFHRDRMTNGTFYIFSQLINSTSANTSDIVDDNDTSNTSYNNWISTSGIQNNSFIWYREPVDPSSGKQIGPSVVVPSDDLINITGISAIHDEDASWHVTVSKFTKSPLLASESPVRDPTNTSTVAVVGVRTALSSVGKLMKELVEMHSGYMYLVSQEGYLLATSTDTPLMMNTSSGLKLITATESSDPIIRAGARWLQEYEDGSYFKKDVHVENVFLGNQRYYIDSFVLNLTRPPVVGVIIIPRLFVMGKVDRQSHAALIILVSASVCILVTGCFCILILTSGVSKEMKLRAELISHLDARRRAEASSNCKSQFLANMSHELRTPMAAVIGLLDILLCDNYLSTEQIDMLSQIRHCSTTLLRLLNNILDLSKVESGKLILEEAEFDIGHELEALVDMFSVQCVDHNIEIVLDLDDNIPRMVCGDSARVVQIFSNLINNSIKFTSSGYIILRGWCENTTINKRPNTASGNQHPLGISSMMDSANERQPSKTQERLTVWFEVEDTGCGIDPSKWDSVFECFVQADLSTTRTYGGTGLGLCIVRSLVQQMKGQINIKPKVGPGTLIRLSLEFGIPPLSVQHFSQHVWSGFARENSVVFLALSDSISRQTMMQWLEQNGICSFEASDWNGILGVLSKIISCSDTGSEQAVCIPSSEDAVNQNKNSEDSSIIKTAGRLFNADYSVDSSKNSYFIVIDARLLGKDSVIWKDQLCHLNKYHGKANFAWLLNHDTSIILKLELKRMGHNIMVNRPLYKSKMVQILENMMVDAPVESEEICRQSQLPSTLSSKEIRTTVEFEIPMGEDSSLLNNFDSHIGKGDHNSDNISARETARCQENLKEERDDTSYHTGEFQRPLKTSEYINSHDEGPREYCTCQLRCDNSKQNCASDVVNLSSSSGLHPICCPRDLRDMKQSSRFTSDTVEQCHGHGRVQFSLEPNNVSPRDEHISDSYSTKPFSEFSNTLTLGSILEEEKHVSLHQPITFENNIQHTSSNQMMSDKYGDSAQLAPKAIFREKSLQGIHILLAEDTVVLQKVAKIVLEKMGASVVAVGDGLQAVNALKSSFNIKSVHKTADDAKTECNEKRMTPYGIQPFDLVLMDCQMPKMDGYEATKEIRAEEEGTDRHIPIIALTAHAMSSDEAKCLGVGMDAYLTKPIDYGLMSSTILSLIKKSR